MKMRELEDRTGVHRETIRVYLREGLIPEPARPRKTVADYGEEHVQAILAVRRLQRENRLTLTQIKTIIAGQGTERRVEASAFDQLEQLVAHRVGVDGPPVTIGSLLERYPHAAEDARTLARIGILDIIDTEQGEALSITCAQLVRIWGDMRKAGFDQRLDYTPEILGFYSQAADFVGRWEATTFLERVGGHVAVDDAVTMVEHALPLMLDFFGLLRQRAFFRHVDAIRAGAEPDRPEDVIIPSTPRP
ncbi:MerR family transcriptional regulator [Sphingobium sp. C100]|nr:MerR family transcriptional regulator [Sphingobium sp. C100]ETI63680.1 MerR family transcriptional regulator [Sphingobium sp. C100]